jgi:glycerol-3-phosphate dehydrogenase (NAD(P)+)
MTATKPDRIAVLGAGSWGTALAILLARNGFVTDLWGHDAGRLEEMGQRRCNPVYLPDIPFPAGLSVRADLGALAGEVRHFLIAVPSHAFRTTLDALALQVDAGITLAWATKGVEPGGCKLLSAAADEVLPQVTAKAIISGPTFAGEVARGLPTALTVASRDLDAAERVADWLRCDHLRAYTTQDTTGVQLGGAVKNVLAIAAGISDGLGFGANARAALITRGLAEMTRLGVALGGTLETFMGLAGVGDLILTCTDDTSRNRRVGLALGRGQTLDKILAELGQVAEGVGTAREIRALAQRLGVDMPITEQVCAVLFEQCPARTAVDALLRRDPRRE